MTAERAEGAREEDVSAAREQEFPDGEQFWPCSRHSAIWLNGKLGHCGAGYDVMHTS